MSVFRAVTWAIVGIALSHVVVAEAQEGRKDPGLRLLQLHCASCHGVTPTDQSRHPSAPHFKQVLKKRYPSAMLAEALAEGISTGHPDMPEFVFQPEQVGAIIDYLDRLSRE